MFKNWRWAMKHDQCIKCNTTESEHKGLWLCTKCWDKRRDSRESRKKKTQEYKKKYAESHPEIVAKIREWWKEWQKENSEVFAILATGKRWKKAGKPCIEYKGKPIPLDITSKDKEEKRKWQAVKHYIDNRTRPWKKL